jgi:hypothetical protein
MIRRFIVICFLVLLASPSSHARDRENVQWNTLEACQGIDQRGVNEFGFRVHSNSNGTFPVHSAWFEGRGCTGEPLGRFFKNDCLFHPGLFILYSRSEEFEPGTVYSVVWNVDGHSTGCVEFVARTRIPAWCEGQ